MAEQHERLNYTVLVPFPKGGGHWAEAGEKLDLLDVEASALRAAGRVRLTSELAAEAAATPATKKATKASE